MDTIRLQRVYVPTLNGPGPLVVMTTARPRCATALQQVARPCHRVAEAVARTALDCKRKALLLTSALLIKLASIGKSIIKYVKKDFLKKEGVPLKGLVIYKGSARGVGKMLGNAM